MGKNNKDRDDPSLKFTIKDVRCFEGEQIFDIRPLTFLIGENSTGKSTALGCFHVLNNFIYTDKPSGFNDDPYQMGSSVDIIRRVDGAEKKYKGFQLGFTLDNPIIKFNVHFVESKTGAEPNIEEIQIHTQEITIRIQVDQKKMKYRCDFHPANEELSSLEETFPKYEDSLSWYRIFDILRFKRLRFNKMQSNLSGNDQIDKQKDILYDLDNDIRKNLIYILESVAPIRSKPKRTYDPIREIPDSSGNDVPMLLMRLNMNEKDRWKEIHRRIVVFGKASGLFTDIEIKKYGKSMGEPFQLRFNVRGVKANIMDTGYGVSQILPLLARIFDASKAPRRVGRRSFLSRRGQHKFLLQQPEVHLHPKGQAELTSLFIESIKEYSTSFLIETHSDYMIDRARIEIRKGLISPDQVSLIYLEPEGDKVKVHNLSFDEDANLKNMPDGYRDFFLKESDRLLGFGD